MPLCPCACSQPRYRELVMSPQVLTLQLVWDQQVSGEQIRDVLSQVQVDLDISGMYDVIEVRQGVGWLVVR